MLTIVPFYASLLAPLYFFLAMRVIRMRRQNRIAIGDGNNPLLQRAIRVHANFAEYAPFALLLAAFVELQESSPVVIHLIGSALLVGRVVHAYGVSREKENYKLRILGMGLTFGAIGISALRLLGSVFIGR